MGRNSLLTMIAVLIPPRPARVEPLVIQRPERRRFAHAQPATRSSQAYIAPGRVSPVCSDVRPARPKDFIDIQTR
jgi:hypothetical protein